MFKNKQKYFLISVLLMILFLAASGTAFGVDLNENLEVPEVSVCKDNLENSQNDIVGSSEITLNGGKFSDIQKAIDDIDNGGTIHLNGYYSAQNKDSHVYVNKNINIVGGSDTVLDGKNISCIFSIQKTGSNCQISNLKFVNGMSGHGGAMIVLGKNVVIKDSVFENNYADYAGAAIYVCSIFNDSGKYPEEGENLIIKNCNFTNNFAQVAAGAIGVYGNNTKVIGCNFVSNKVKPTSNHEAYVDAVRTDNFLRRTGAIKITERPETGAIRTVNPQSRDKIWVSEYAEGYAKGRYGEDYLTHPASEDLAESGATYFANKEWFRQNFPTRYEVIDKVLNSEGREVIDELATQQSDYKFLKSNALTKTKNRVTKYFSKSSTPKEHDKFKLTSSQERNYKKLSIRKESLGFLDKRKLEKLENQVKFNTLHNKKLASNLSYEENKQYKQLYNQFRKEFNLPELKSSERNIFNDLLNRESKRTQNKFEKHLEKLKNTKEFKTDGKTFINFAKDSDDKIIIQVNLQNLNKKQKEILNKWSADIDIYLKDWCHKSTNPNYLEKYVSKKITYEECDKLGKELTNLIESLSTEQTLQENTILWRGIGMKDERMDLSNFVVGEKRKFGEFTSTSFDLDTAESFAMYTDDDEFAGYILKIHAPKGTKGGAIDGERIGNAGTEYEYLLSKNQEYITLNVDENLRIIDILLVN